MAGGEYLSEHKIVIEEKEKQFVVRTECRGVCSNAFKAVPVSVLFTKLNCYNCKRLA